MLTIMMIFLNYNSINPISTVLLSKLLRRIPLELLKDLTHGGGLAVTGLHGNLGQIIAGGK